MLSTPTKDPWGPRKMTASLDGSSLSNQFFGEKKARDTLSKGSWYWPKQRKCSLSKKRIERDISCLDADFQDETWVVYEVDSNL